MIHCLQTQQSPVVLASNGAPASRGSHYGLAELVQVRLSWLGHLVVKKKKERERIEQSPGHLF